MASVNSTGSTYLGTSYEEYQNEQRVAKSQLGKNDFLKLLVAQLQYQDPLEPTKDSDFVAQLAQFSSLEQMENMSKSMAMMQAYDLVGKYVVAPDMTMADGSKVDIMGTVDSVIYKNGEYYAMVGDYVVQISKITEVYDKGFVSPESQITNSAHLIGCTVKSYILDAKGNAVYDPSTEPEKDADGNIKVDEDGNTIYKPSKDLTVVSGVVTGVGFKDGMAIAYVKTADGKETTVPMHLIFDIRPTETPAPVVEPVVNQTANPPVNPPANGTIITPENQEPPPVTEPDDGGDGDTGTDTSNNGSVIITRPPETNPGGDDGGGGDGGGDTGGTVIDSGGGSFIITP